MKPTVRLFIGDPLTGHEARFLRKLYADLVPIGGLILANFHAGQRQIDFVVVTESLAGIIEVKHLPRPVYGRQNGQWFVEDSPGKRTPYPGPNPWQQTLQQKFALSDEMRTYESRVQGGDPTRRFFTEFDGYVCIDPVIHPRSDLTRGDSRVGVRSYSDVIEILRTGARVASWNQANWERFALEHLLLEEATCDQATDPKVRAASNIVRAYLSRVECVVGFKLPPLLTQSADGHGGPALVDTLLARDNHLIVGPSGSSKTFHLHHVAIAAASREEEVPLLIEPRTYRGGDFWSLVRRGVAPMFAGEPRELLDAVRTSGLRTILLVDALNECPDNHLADLLRGVQTFALHYDARVILTAQTHVDLPADLAPSITALQSPVGSNKRSIFSYHAGIADAPELDYLCEGFNNAYELTLAGRCHTIGSPVTSRSELFERYVQSCLQADYHVTTAMLRAISAEMAGEVLSSWERDEYERFAEQFLRQQNASIGVLDQLKRSGLIRLTDEFFAFEHELLGDFFAATAVHRQHANDHSLANELKKPRNQKLIELILPRLDDEEVASVLSVTADRQVLSRVLVGQCGERAQAVLRKQITSFLKLATEDVANITCRCYIADLEDGRRILGGVSLEGHRDWNSYCLSLCGLVAHHLDDPEISARFLELLDVTEWALRQAATKAGAETGIKVHRVWEELLRTHGGIMRSSTVQLPCAAILEQLRSQLMSYKSAGGSPLWQNLLARAIATPENHFALLSILQDKRHFSDDHIDTILDLVRRAWESGIYILRIDSMEFTQWIRGDLSDGAAERVCALLKEFETDHIIENTTLLESLSRYGALESPVSPEDALKEMRGTIAPGASSEPNIVEAARAFGTSPTGLLASTAMSCLSRIFEDVFCGAYGEAYYELSREEKVAILALASESPHARYHPDWLLRELLEHGGSEALPVYLRFAEGVDGESCCPQDATAAYVLAVEGCARFMEAPPPYKRVDGIPHRAWAALGEILFWAFRNNEVARSRWSQFEGPTRLAAADVVYHLATSYWKIDFTDHPTIDLLTLHKAEIRPILEDCLRERESLSSVFNFGGSRNRSVISHLISTLGTIGNEGTARLLHTILDDMEFGTDALRAIESIRGKHA